MLLNTSSCARGTVRPNKPKHQSLEQRRVYRRAEQGAQMAHTQNPRTPRRFLRKSFYRQNLGWGLHCCFLTPPPLFLHPLPSLISSCLNLPLGTQGRSRRLNEAYCLRIRNREHRKYLYPGAPQGPGLVSIASVSQGKISILQDCHPTPPPTHFRYQLQAQVITCASDRTGIDWRFPTTPSLDFRH